MSQKVNLHPRNPYQASGEDCHSLFCKIIKLFQLFPQSRCAWNRQMMCLEHSIGNQANAQTDSESLKHWSQGRTLVSPKVMNITPSV